MTEPPRGEARKCGNLSRKEWVVRTAAQGLEVSLRRSDAEEDPLPFAIKGRARDGLAGARHVRRVPDGFLVGFDGGEYGGALWWFAASGDRRALLAEGNVIGFASLGDRGTFALTGYARRGFSRGQMLSVSTSPPWSATPWLDFHGAVEGFFEESPESLVVLTTIGISRVTACGDVTRLVQADFDALYPTSLVIDGSGVLYVGMRHFLARFVPAPSGFREEWMTPKDCTTFAARHFECLCSAR